MTPPDGRRRWLLRALLVGLFWFLCSRGVPVPAPVVERVTRAVVSGEIQPKQRARRAPRRERSRVLGQVAAAPPSPAPVRAAPAVTRQSAPAVLVLEHEELMRRLVAGRVRKPSLEYSVDQVVVGLEVRVLVLSIPVRIHARFERAGGRVRLALQGVTASGRAVPAGRRAEAAAKLARLVDVAAGGATRVEVRQGVRVVYAQEIRDP